MSNSARLIFAGSDHCADMLYAVGLFVPDPFIWAQVGRQRYLVVSPLEYGRAKSSCLPRTRVFNRADLHEQFGIVGTSAVDQIVGLSRHCGVKRWEVPTDFPLGLANQLARRRLKVVPVSGMLFPGREIKRPDEVEKITAGLRLAEAGLEVALDILRRSRIVGDHLLWRNETLTAECLRGEIDAEISRLGGIAAHTIVAPGCQGADPHNVGSGPILPHQTLIMDIFPRVTATGYFGDLTRTVVKGKAPAVVKRAYAAVRKARNTAIKKIKPGVSSAGVYRLAASIMTDAGFPTDLHADPPVGFFHGLGHGVGLEIHEAPSLSAAGKRLRRGQVVTVEPGLYYPEWGGVRLEDMVAIEAKRCRNLTRVPSQLEIS